MASTGLLTGINPYKSGNVAVDFSSKPTQYAIQEIQHQQAKAEATDKYFMYWEKSINPAGLAKGELDVFANKLRAAKEYGIKNKEQINNPSKYGYDAQSTLTALFKDAQNYIEEGKQATASRKAFKSYLDSARKSGKHIKNDFEVLGNAMKTVGYGYVEPDSSMVDIFDPFDAEKFREKTWKGIDLPGDIITEKQTIGEKKDDKGNIIDIGKQTGMERGIKIESITPEVAKNYDTRTKSYFREDKGTQEQYDKLFEDKDYVKQFNPIYEKLIGKKIESAAELLSAEGLATKQPKREVMSQWDYPKTWYQDKATREQKDMVLWKQNIDDARTRNDYSDLLVNLDKSATGIQQVVNKGKKENWRRMPLPKSVKEQLTIPTVVFKIGANGPVTGSGKMEDVPVEEILITPTGKLMAYAHKLDEDGKPINNKFEQREINIETVADKLIGGGAGSGNRGVAIKAAVDNFKKHISLGAETWAERKAREAKEKNKK
jgi:hypothetical protein